MADDGRLEYEVEDLIQLRHHIGSELYILLSDLAKKEERKESRKELNAWLDRVWANFANNVRLRDNPKFNFSEPIIKKATFDEALQVKVKDMEHKLQEKMEDLIELRKKTTNILKPLANEIIIGNSTLVNKLKVVDNEAQQSLPILDSNVTKEVEPACKDTIELLSQLEQKVPIIATDIEQFLSTTQDIKSLY